MKKRWLILTLCVALFAIPATLCAAPMDAAPPQTLCAAGGTSYIIDDNHTLWACGNNSQGQLGNGGQGNLQQKHVTVQTTPIKIMENVASVSSSGLHTLAVGTDGVLWGWGSNRAGQLGVGVTGDGIVDGWGETYAKPVQIMTGVQAASAGEDFSLILKTDGTLWGCGIADCLGLGNHGDVVNPYYTEIDITGQKVDHYFQTHPVQIKTGVRAICASRNHAFAITGDDVLWGWGKNRDLSLGVGDDEEQFWTPQQIMTGVRSVSSAYSHTLAVKTDGTLWAWGRNDFGQLGNGQAQDMKQVLFAAKPVKIMDNVQTACAAGNTALYAMYPSHFSLALKTDGTLWAWGSNDYGQLGNGGASNFTAAYNKASQYQHTLPAVNTPQKIMSGVAAISASDFHALARKTDGTLWAWGLNDLGPLANDRQGNARSSTDQIYQTVPAQFQLP